MLFRFNSCSKYLVFLKRSTGESISFRRCDQKPLLSSTIDQPIAPPTFSNQSSRPDRPTNSTDPKGPRFLQTRHSRESGLVIAAERRRSAKSNGSRGGGGRGGGRGRRWRRGKKERDESEKEKTPGRRRRRRRRRRSKNKRRKK